MSNGTASFYLTGTAAVLLIGRWVWSYLRRPQCCRRSPPGPPGLPILGNARDIPSVDSHLAYSNFARKYGPIMQFQVLGNVVIVISDMKVALELLDHRGAIYSGRPKFYTVLESGFTWNLAFMPNDNVWRIRRQLVHNRFHAKSIVGMHGLLRHGVLTLARDMLRSPDRFREHVQHVVSSIMNAVYGIAVADAHDPYAEIAERMMRAFAAVIPGVSLMDAVPLLRYVPTWVPVLGSWKAKAHALRKCSSTMLEVPYARAKDDLVCIHAMHQALADCGPLPSIQCKGKARPCMAHEASERMQTDATITEQVIKDTCAVSYFGGTDPIGSAVLAFILAMVLSPESQRTAQAELDRVLGDRLPEFADQASLPYVEAIVRETFRCYPVGPLGVPHAVDGDDDYNGYFIRGGSTVLVNIWHILHDDATYPEPGTFRPDRWLKNGRVDESSQDPRFAIFGFGRRICPGRYFTDASVFLTIATVLKCFEISSHVENGIEIPPSGRIDTGLTSCPAPFKCRIVPRSQKIGEMIDTALGACV